MDQNTVFQTVLGEDWNALGDIIQRHYFLKAKSNDNITVSGEMTEVSHTAVAKLLIPFGLIFGALVPFKGKNVPTDVHYRSRLDDSNIYWDRVFKFERGDFHFKSFMQPVAKNQVIEFVRFGVGIRLAVTVEDQALVFRDIAYVWRIMGINLPIPGKWLMGRIYVEERPIDERFFSMKMTMTHPWFGPLFKYSGKFELVSNV